VNAMRTHSTNADLQRHGCSALKELASNFQTRQTLIDLGALEVVREASELHPRLSICKEALRMLE